MEWLSQESSKRLPATTSKQTSSADVLRTFHPSISNPLTGINEWIQNIKDCASGIDPNGYFQRFPLSTDRRTSGSASPAVNSD
jgi:hypothetical protein